VQWASEGIAPKLLTSALRGGKYAASHLTARAPNTWMFLESCVCYLFRIPDVGQIPETQRKKKILMRAQGSIVVEALCYKPERRGFETQCGEWLFPILPAALGPGVYSASNRNEYQKQKNNVSGE
jgi:hypothetical protein